MRAAGAPTHQPRVRYDRTGNPGAVHVWSFMAVDRVESLRDRVGQFDMLGVDPGVDHGDPDIRATRELVRFGQSQLEKRILRRVALGRLRLLLLQQIAEIRLHRANAGFGGEFTAHGLDRAAVGGAEQGNGDADQREILGLDPPQPVTPGQFIGLRIGERRIDLGQDLASNRAAEWRCCKLAARAAVLALGGGATAATAVGGSDRLAKALAIGVAISRAARGIEVRRIAGIRKLRLHGHPRRQMR